MRRKLYRVGLMVSVMLTLGIGWLSLRPTNTAAAPLDQYGCWDGPCLPGAAPWSSPPPAPWGGPPVVAGYADAANFAGYVNLTNAIGYQNVVNAVTYQNLANAAAYRNAVRVATYQAATRGR